MRRILATAALFFLLLRPVCDVLAAGAIAGVQEQDAHSVAHQDVRGGSALDHDVPCCADVEDGTVSTLSESANVRVTSESKLAVAAPARTATHFVGASSAGARHPPGVLHTSTSYYARSARIRR
ncbi:MAG: hypothetical protein OEZ09_10980 [Betaproteobacteria bacterium]|nr:hypothetical protein [Betaproteobacteria bacterium]MDH5578967.1 hypothetical protein [Betaproteobacteria bacterium]